MRAGSVCRGALAMLAASGSLLADDLADATRVPEAVLEEVRGGFDIPENLHASLMLERIARVNGEQVAHLTVDIPDIGRMTAEQASALAEAAGPLVIQNGPANSFNLADVGPASTVIQNTLTDQHIVALTTISVAVNTLGAYQQMIFHDGLAQALGGIAGVR